MSALFRNRDGGNGGSVLVRPPTMATFSLPMPLHHVASNWSFTDSILVAAVTSFITYLVFLQFTASAIPSYSRYTPFLTQWNFFAKRPELLADAFKRFNGAMFRMKIIGYPVIVARSHQARAFFFGDRHLSFTEGYKILMGGVRQRLSVPLASLLTLRNYRLPVSRKSKSSRRIILATISPGFKIVSLICFAKSA
jgi:hypothetical protein